MRSDGGTTVVVTLDRAWDAQVGRHRADALVRLFDPLTRTFSFGKLISFRTITEVKLR